MTSEIYKIPLRNKDKQIIDYSVVDKDDYENAKQYTWCRFNGYAVGKVNNKTTSLHCLILGKPDKGYVIDHIDGDGLNNTRANLRFASNAENSQNRPKKEGCTSSYIGVSIHPKSKKWTAWYAITYLGSFDDELLAAKKYDTYVYLKYGPNANTNNTVNYEDIKDIDINSLLCKRKARDLPKNISIKRKSFLVAIVYKKQRFGSVEPTLEKAIEKLEEFKQQIEEIKKQEQDRHNNQDIERNEQGVAIIPLSSRDKTIVGYTMVSDNMWHMLRQHTWHTDKFNYVKGCINQKMVRMHRFIMNAPDDKIVDHINNERLDNRTENLRIADHVVNNHNKAKKGTATSQYHGIWFVQSKNRWASEIRKDNVRYFVGQFKSEIAAAVAYNAKASELYGEFAKLNILDD